MMRFLLWLVGAEGAVQRGAEEAQQSYRGGSGGAEAGERLADRDREAALAHPGSAWRDCGGGHCAHPVQIHHHHRGRAQPADHLRQFLGSSDNNYNKNNHHWAVLPSNFCVWNQRSGVNFVFPPAHFCVYHGR
uniref:Uncharacterized protein n=1 Tax=Arundo donax TaxID=35708 RepID=A0A0A9CF76_ARUDO